MIDKRDCHIKELVNQDMILKGTIKDVFGIFTEGENQTNYAIIKDYQQ